MVKRVIIYSTPTCPHCDKVKEFLKNNDIDFTEYNVQENMEKAKEMIQETGKRTVPVTKINGEIVIGSNLDKIKKLLEI